MKDGVSFVGASMAAAGILGVISAVSGLIGFAIAATVITVSHLPVLIRAAIWDWHDWGDGRKWDSVEFTNETEIPDIVRHQITNIEQRGRRLLSIRISFDESFKDKRVGKVSVVSAAPTERAFHEWFHYIFFLSGPPKPVEN